MEEEEEGGLGLREGPRHPVGSSGDLGTIRGAVAATRLPELQPSHGVLMWDAKQILTRRHGLRSQTAGRPGVEVWGHEGVREAAVPWVGRRGATIQGVLAVALA